MRIGAPKRERRAVLKELTQFDSKPKDTRRFIKSVVSGTLDPYLDYKLRKNRFGKFRSISSPFPELKELQKRVLHDIYSLSCHEAAHAYVPGRSVVTAASEHLGMNWGIKLDLEDFFHHVTGRHIEKALAKQTGLAKAEVYAALCTRAPEQTRNRIPTKFNRRHGIWVARDWRLWLVGKSTAKFGPGLPKMDEQSAARSITYKLLSGKRRIRRYLPQGSPTSGYMANLAFAPVDAKIARLTRKLGFTYTRYSDDILISTSSVVFDRELATKIIHKVQKLVADEGFTLNRAKTRILTPGSRKSYLGLIVSGQTTRLPREVRERITAELRDIKKFGFDSQALRFEAGLSRIGRSAAKHSNTENSYWHVLRGYLCWVQKADSKLFEDLEDIYRPHFAGQPFPLNSKNDPDGDALARLFERKDSTGTSDAAQTIDAVMKITDIYLDY